MGAGAGAEEQLARAGHGGQVGAGVGMGAGEAAGKKEPTPEEGLAADDSLGEGGAKAEGDGEVEGEGEGDCEGEGEGEGAAVGTGATAAGEGTGNRVVAESSVARVLMPPLGLLGRQAGTLESTLERYLHACVYAYVFCVKEHKENITFVCVCVCVCLHLLTCCGALSAVGFLRARTGRQSNDICPCATPAPYGTHLPYTTCAPPSSGRSTTSTMALMRPRRSVHRGAPAAAHSRGAEGGASWPG